jgi:hypothetical protein
MVTRHLARTQSNQPNMGESMATVPLEPAELPPTSPAAADAAAGAARSACTSIATAPAHEATTSIAAARVATSGSNGATRGRRRAASSTRTSRPPLTGKGPGFCCCGRWARRYGLVHAGSGGFSISTTASLRGCAWHCACTPAAQQLLGFRRGGARIGNSTGLDSAPDSPSEVRPPRPPGSPVSREDRPASPGRRRSARRTTYY